MDKNKLNNQEPKKTGKVSAEIGTKVTAQDTTSVGTKVTAQDTTSIGTKVTAQELGSEATAAATQTITGAAKKPTKLTIFGYIKSLPKKLFIDAFSGMAMGLFCTLIAGTIISQIGLLVGDNVVGNFLISCGTSAKILMGGGIGAGIALALKAPRLVVFSCIVSGFIGANASSFVSTSMFVGNGVIIPSPGDPIGAYFATVFSCEIGKLIFGKTHVDILAVPLVVLTIGALSAVILGPPVAMLLSGIGAIINEATRLQPLFMGMVVAAIMGMLLTLPTSSAAIGVVLGLDGIAAGAAVAGCCAHMIGFAVISFRENRWSGLISQGLGTSMLQIPNLAKNARILIPVVISSIVCGAMSAAVFGLTSNAVGSGMGSAGLVGVIMTFTTAIKTMDIGMVIFGIAVCQFILPIVVSLLVSEFMRKRNWIKLGEMKVDEN